MGAFDVLGIGKLDEGAQYLVVLLVGAHLCAFGYWMWRICTDKKRIDLKFKSS
ncbi:unnamed protein product [Choristocarpus tenellus]